MKVKYTFAIILICASLFILSSCGMTPEEKIKECLESGDYSKAVEIYNEKQIENDEEILSTMSGLVDFSMENWSTEIVSFEETQEMLQAFLNIDDKELAKKANETLELVIIEQNGNTLYEEAEIFFESSEFLDAMKSVVNISDEYSLYEEAQELYSDAKAAYVMEISFPNSLDEYETCIDELEIFLGKCYDKELVDEITRLKKEHGLFKKTIVITDKADKYYDEGSYKKAFTTLEEGAEKYPQNRYLSNKQDELGNIYIVAIAEQVKPLIEDKKYKDALKIVEEAQENYSCNAFDQLEDLIKDKKSIIHRWSSSFVAGWKEEILEVKREGAIAYAEKSGKKLILGNYSDEDVTILSTAGNIGVALAGFDMPMDARDLVYDIQNWGEEEYFVLHLATDAIAIIPVIGAVKYAKYMKKANLTDDVTEIVAKRATQYADTAKGVIKHREYVKTINQHLKGKRHHITGVKFVSAKADYSNGRKIAAVVPRFDYIVQYKLPEKAWLLSRESHKKTLNNRLLNQVETKDTLKSKFTDEQIEDLRNGDTPRGYTWHHTEQEGVMQLVDAEVHEVTKHTGGYSLWGKGSIEENIE